MTDQTLDPKQIAEDREAGGYPVWRIARVPDLEAHYLATLPLIEAADALEAAILKGDPWEIAVTIAAYRKARLEVGK